ncbi:glutaredoxin family protein [Gammaproteobacteria bacterium]|nr:glutaredoxin family protein [Gammaproteobacteria bacterium]
MAFRALALIISTFFIVLFSSNLLAAVKIVECEDEQGNKVFQKSCPPGSTQVGSKKFKIGKAPKNIIIRATLFVIPDCDACDDVRDFLSDRNIPMTEKNVSDNTKLQSELKKLTDVLEVPVTIIGDEILTGYSRSKLLTALKKSGYTEKN